MKEQRGESRLSGAVVRRIAALVRPGQWAIVIDLSPSGALIAGRRPLRPGAVVDVYFESDGRRAAARATVVRCSVAAMDADRVVYHAGLAFEDRAEWVRERQTRSESPIPGRSPMSSLASVHSLPGRRADSDAPVVEHAK